MTPAVSLGSQPDPAFEPDRRAHRMTTLSDLTTTTMTTTASDDGPIDVIMGEVAQTLGADVSWLSLYEPAAGAVHVIASHGSVDPDFCRMAVPLGCGLGGVAVATRQTVVAHDYAGYRAGTPKSVHDTMLREGIASAMCAPIQMDDVMLGALYVGNRVRSTFSENANTALRRLATVGARSFAPASWPRAAAAGVGGFGHARELHRTLLEASLSAETPHEIAEILSRLMGRTILLEQRVVRPRRSMHRVDEPVGLAAGSDTEMAYGVPILSGGEQLGQLGVDRTMSASERLLLNDGALAIAVVLQRLHAVQEAEQRAHGDLFDVLLDGQPPHSETVRLRAERAKIDVGTARRVCVVQLEEPRDVDVLRSTVNFCRWVEDDAAHPADPQVLISRRGDRVVLGLPDSPPDREADLIASLQRALGAGRVLVGVGELTSDLACSYRQAVACLRLAEESSVENSIVRIDDLGPMAFVLDSADHTHAMRMAGEILAPIITKDKEGRAPLLDTLRAFLLENGHQGRSAARCFIHVNTLKYRVGLLEELLGGPLMESERRFRLELALRLSDLFDKVGSRATTGFS